MNVESNRKAIIASFILTVSLLLVSAWAYQFNWQYSPRKANIYETLENAQGLIGKRILLTGFTQTWVDFYSVSPEEICSYVMNRTISLISETEMPEYSISEMLHEVHQMIELEIPECSGTECDYSCYPINILDTEMFSFYGTLVEGQIGWADYILVDIDLARSSQLVDSRWQKLIPRNYITQKIIIDPETGEQIYP